MAKKSISIEESHKRSKEYGVESTYIYPRHLLSETELKQNLKKNEILLSVSNPILHQLFKAVSGSGFFINLTDAKGCIISIMGDDNILEEAQKLKMVSGAFMDESSIGTNSMGVVLKEKQPVQITAKEHFISAYHKWTCSAAPIFFEEEVVGVINMTGFAEKVHPHSLGIVVSAAQAIENKLKERKSMQLLETSNQFAFAMMNNLTFGVMAINIQDEIEWVNDTACRMLNTRRSKLINKEINELLTDWKRILKIILYDLLFIDEPIMFNIPDIKERFLINAYVIRGQKNSMHGYLITFRQYSRVVNLIKKFAGHHAKFTFEDMISDSPAMVNLKQQALKASTKPSTILLSGESGTGKEVFAQSIHNASLRNEGPFIAINCGALPESLIESELFGYEDGAFTGAKKGGSLGKFELANKGTLFLDEIGEMNAEMQVRLLRSIQDGRITRIGGKNEIELDVRIIAATNKNLEIEIKNGNFRLDLYYRLNVIKFHIPPLRDRKEDILPMARFFAAQKAEKIGRTMPLIDKKIENLLLNYPWPGNVRELENAMERFIVMDGDFSFFESSDNSITKKNIPVETEKIIDTNRKSLFEIEKQSILNSLEYNNNNMSKTAKELGISRNTLYQKLKRINSNN